MIRFRHIEGHRGKGRKRKSLASIQSAIEEHRQKNAEERSKPSPDEDLIRFWQKEIENLENRLVRVTRQLTKHQRRRKKASR